MPENKDNEERKNEFIDAAEKLFKENGIVETTISSIVKEMDVCLLYTSPSPRDTR